MRKRDRDGKTGTNPWGQYRGPAVKLKRVGDEVIHEQKSNDTIGELRADYNSLFGEVRQLSQFVDIKMRRGSKPTADEVIAAFENKAPYLFGDSRTPGYATRLDVEEFLQGQLSNFRFTRSLMAKAWDLKPSVIDTYLKPGRRKNKKA
jgi:hypothetical protein